MRRSIAVVALLIGLAGLALIADLPVRSTGHGASLAPAEVDDIAHDEAAPGSDPPGGGSETVGTHADLPSEPSTADEALPARAQARSTDLDWFSDWSGRVGNDYEALHDGGKWTGNLCTDTHLATIMSAVGRDFPPGMEHLYRYQIPDSNECYLLEVRDQWTLPAVGEYQFVRYYVRFEAPPGHSPMDQHFFHLGTYPGAGYESTFWLNGIEGGDPPGSVGRNGEYRIQFMPNWQGDEARWGVAWYNIYLRTFETYRVELRQHRVAEQEVRYSVRVYDASGNLRNASPGQVWFEYYGEHEYRDLPDFRMGVRNPESHFQTIQVGYNGSSPQGNFAGGVYNFVGGVAVRVTGDARGWIGPYGPGG